MTKLLARIVAVVTAAGMLFPSLGQAGQNLNHNDTLLRD